MKSIVVCIRDIKSALHKNLFVARSVPDAIRSFASAVNTKSQENMLYLYPDDFELLQIGEFYEEVGNIVSVDTKHLANGRDVFVNKE